MKNLEKFLKAIANRRRLAILNLLMKNKEMHVAALAEGIRLSFRSTSRHLAILANLDLVGKDQRKLYVYYSLHKKHLPLVKFILSYESYSHE